jgi:hypothetical protein
VERQKTNELFNASKECGDRLVARCANLVAVETERFDGANLGRARVGQPHGLIGLGAADALHFLRDGTKFIHGRWWEKDELAAHNIAAPAACQATKAAENTAELVAHAGEVQCGVCKTVETHGKWSGGPTSYERQFKIPVQFFNFRSNADPIEHASSCSLALHNSSTGAESNQMSQKLGKHLGKLIVIGFGLGAGIELFMNATGFCTQHHIALICNSICDTV